MEGHRNGADLVDPDLDQDEFNPRTNKTSKRAEVKLPKGLDLRSVVAEFDPATSILTVLIRKRPQPFKHQPQKNSNPISPEPELAKEAFDDEPAPGPSTDLPPPASLPSARTTTTPVRTERGFICSHCGASFQLAGTLKRHELTHTGEKPWHCLDCGKSFTQASSLKRHRLGTHAIDSPYRCKTCGMRFAAPHSLASHERLHTGEKPYVCDRCSAAFADKGQLRRHAFTHTGERPYDCPHPGCEATFSDRSALARHKITHEGKPFKCVFEGCDKSYADRSTLARHAASHLV